MRDRYSVIVGLLFLAVIVVATIQTLSGGGGEGTLGLDRQPPRWPLPEFAVPAAAGELEGDANVAQDDCESSAVPCPEDARRTPACRIDTPGAIRVCDLFDRPLVISFWFTKGGDCAAQQDVVDAVYRRYRGRVNFLSLDIRDDRDTVRELIRQHGWKMPVGYDRDGAVGQPLQGRRLPDLRLRLPRRHPRQRQHRRPHRGPARGPGRAAARTPAGRRRGADELARRSGSRAWTPLPSRAGWRRTSPPSSPASGSPGSRSRPARAQPGAGPAPPARPLRPLLRRPGDPPARTADPLGLPGLLPPDRPRPRPHPHPDRAARLRAHPRRGVQEPTACPPTRSPSPPSRPGSPCAPSTPTGSAARLCIRDSGPGRGAARASPASSRGAR